MYGVGVENTYHNYPGEAFWSLYITYFIDHTWQDSFLAVKTRQERDVNYKITREIQELIDAGINIPDIVKERKEEMLEFYKITQKNLQEKSSNPGIVIGIEINENDDNQIKYKKIEEVLKLCKQYETQEKNIKIYIQGYSDANVLEILRKKLENKISIEMVNTFENELKKYQENNASKWFHITDSPRVMNEAMISIQKGALPIMFSIPNDNISYIDQIEELYSNILRIKGKQVRELGDTEFNDGVK